ncbi:MAG: type II secretion system F family protein [Ancrocorticia sp.]|uniref:type II secretion system F family protein n=1 Tax=Ancrocorticia sp. TaxID=2593684 RepID=UPI003F91866C
MIIGALGGLGIALIITALVSPHPTLEQRVMPYRHHDWHRPRSHLLDKALHAAANVLEKIGSTNSSVERRLAMLGTSTLRDFRLTQLQWTGAGFAAGLAAALVLLARTNSLILGLTLAIGGGLAGALAADSRLTRRATRHSQALTAQLPDAAELMALAVSAGEPMRAALERVSSIGSGELAKEIDRTLGEVRAGSSMEEALVVMGERSGSGQVGRFCDALVSATQRGTPIAQVLAAQVQDARDQARRELLEIGGKREITMMLPVVFLILPVTVLFTLYPGLQALTFIT